MTMEVNEKVHHPVLHCLINHFLRCSNFRRKLGWELPLPVEIEAIQATPLIAIYYSIGIQHRNYFEDEVISEKLGAFAALLQQEGNCTLHDIRANCFPRVNSRCENDGFPLGDIFISAIEISDYKFEAVVASRTLAKDTLPCELRILSCAHSVIQEVQQVGVGVRVAICDVNIIGFVLEYHFKDQGALISRSSIILGHVILEVLNVEAIAVPACAA